MFEYLTCINFIFKHKQLKNHTNMSIYLYLYGHLFKIFILILTMLYGYTIHYFSNFGIVKVLGCYIWFHQSWYVYSGCDSRWITLPEECPSKTNKCFPPHIAGSTLILVCVINVSSNRQYDNKMEVTGRVHIIPQ